MSIHRLIIILLSYVFYLVLSVPTPLTSPNLSNADGDLSINFPHIYNGSIIPEAARRVNTINSTLGLSPSFTNHSTSLDYWTTTWPIRDTTLSLTINVGPWDLAPEKIIQTLEAAQITAGKKQAGLLLDRNFKSETGSYINTMIFEIGPEFIYKRLTWGDVGEVLGENGLPRFFQSEEEWHSVYFEVVDSERGSLGNGAVRKWYM